MAVIIDENVSASLEEKLGANVWWKPDLDKKTLKSLCIKRSGPGILYVSLYFIALISMGYLAYITWGTYWSWDPKETWALITWLNFAAYLHVRLIVGLNGKIPAAIASLGFFVVWICYLGVNFLGQGLHSYGWVS